VEKAEQALLRYKEKHSIITDFSSDVENITAQKLAHLNTPGRGSRNQTGLRQKPVTNKPWS